MSSPHAQQNAIVVIETHPIKKVKTEQADSSDKMDDSDIGDASIPMASMVESRNVFTPSKNRSRAKTTKNDLPLLMQDDLEDKWSKNVLPSVILWYGDQPNVWNINESKLEHVLAAVITVVYPTFNEPKELKHRGHVYNLAVQQLSRWCHVIRNAAGHVVLKHLKNNAKEAKGLTTEDLATNLLTLRAFAYEDFNASDASKAFRSPLIHNLLATTHLQDTIGWVEVPGLDLLAKCDHGIKGVLALCTAALECALQLAEGGQLQVDSITTKVEDSEAQTVQKSDIDVDPTSGNWTNWKQELLMNGKTGRRSRKGTAFSYQNWGWQTSLYYKSIAKRSDETLENIVAKALLYLATYQEARDNGDAFYTSTVALDVLDPRAQMCKLLPIATTPLTFPRRMFLLCLFPSFKFFSHIPIPTLVSLQHEPTIGPYTSS
ncbi:hypothetical protein JVU11DRAFT_7315 [Chiua virens]|nr:hypothetical protein JVU11DRAFT_7315 [Chiua virens]